MKNGANLFQLLELTRSQPQYGYALSGIPKGELSDLAQHHYLVTMIAWALGSHLEKNGCTIDLAKLLKMCLVHDIGELFGGDIAAPYAKANPKARALAKQFEAENLQYITEIFDESGLEIAEYTEEVTEQKTTEGIVAKIADYIECTHYKNYMRRLTEGDINLVERTFERQVSGLDEKTRKTLSQFLSEWSTELRKLQNKEYFEEFKN